MKKTSCSIETCNFRHYARGYCKKHYEQARRHGEFEEKILSLDYKIYPLGYADKNRPEWHKVSK